MLLGFSPSDLAFCFTRSWDRSEGTQDQCLPQTSSSGSPEFTFHWWGWTLSKTANYFITRWEWWGWRQQDQESQEGCTFNLGGNFRGCGLPVELGGVMYSQSKEAVTGRWKMRRLFPTCLSCLLCWKLVAPHGAYTSPPLSLQELWTQASDPNEPLAMNAAGLWKGFSTANQKWFMSTSISFNF